MTNEPRIHLVNPADNSMPLAAYLALRDAKAVIQSAMESHIYDETNGEAPEPGCIYQAMVDRIEQLLAGEASPRLAVTLEGGMCSAVIGTGALVGLPVTIIDYDTEGDDDAGQVEQGDGSIASAWIHHATVEAADITIPGAGQ